MTNLKIKGPNAQTKKQIDKIIKDLKKTNKESVQKANDILAMIRARSNPKMHKQLDLKAKVQQELDNRDITVHFRDMLPKEQIIEDWDNPIEKIARAHKHMVVLCTDFPYGCDPYTYQTVLTNPTTINRLYRMSPRTFLVHCNDLNNSYIIDLDNHQIINEVNRVFGQSGPTQGNYGWDNNPTRVKGWDDIKHHPEFDYYTKLANIVEDHQQTSGKNSD